MFGRWRRWRKELCELEAFQRTAFGFLDGVRRKAGRTLWSMAGLGEGREEKLKEVAASGARLEAMMTCATCGGWKDVLLAKAYYQTLYEARLRSPQAGEAADQERFGAAREWSAIEGFFSELHRRVRFGHKAAEKLNRLAVKV